MAESISRHSDAKYKMGAILVSRGRILGYGISSKKSHPIHKIEFSDKKIYLHAESDLLRKVKTVPRRSTLIVVRSLKKSAMLAPSFPCDYCIRLIFRSLERGPLYLIYVNDDYELAKIEISEREINQVLSLKRPLLEVRKESPEGEKEWIS